MGSTKAASRSRGAGQARGLRGVKDYLDAGDYLTDGKQLVRVVALDYAVETEDCVHYVLDERGLPIYSMVRLSYQDVDQRWRRVTPEDPDGG